MCAVMNEFDISKDEEGMQPQQPSLEAQAPLATAASVEKPRSSRAKAPATTTPSAAAATAAGEAAEAGLAAAVATGAAVAAAAQVSTRAANGQPHSNPLGCEQRTYCQEASAGMAGSGEQRQTLSGQEAVPPARRRRAGSLLQGAETQQRQVAAAAAAEVTHAAPAAPGPAVAGNIPPGAHDDAETAVRGLGAGSAGSLPPRHLSKRDPRLQAFTRPTQSVKPAAMAASSLQAHTAPAVVGNAPATAALDKEDVATAFQAAAEAAAAGIWRAAAGQALQQGQQEQGPAGRGQAHKRRRDCAEDDDAPSSQQERHESPPPCRLGAHDRAAGPATEGDQGADTAAGADSGSVRSNKPPALQRPVWRVRPGSAAELNHAAGTASIGGAGTQATQTAQQRLADSSRSCSANSAASADAGGRAAPCMRQDDAQGEPLPPQHAAQLPEQAERHGQDGKAASRQACSAQGGSLRPAGVADPCGCFVAIVRLLTQAGMRPESMQASRKGSHAGGRMLCLTAGSGLFCCGVQKHLLTCALWIHYIVFAGLLASLLDTWR